MNTNFPIDHVALLVPSIEASLLSLREIGPRIEAEIGEMRSFSIEGTLECYVGGEKDARLLLIEAVSEGPYLRALEKRGPGLHHVAIRAGSASQLHESLEGSGWLLHPYSLISLESSQSAWVCRPGVPFLVEALLSDTATKPQAFIERLELPLEEGHVNAVGLLLPSFCYRSTRPEARLVIQGQPITMGRFLRGEAF